MKKKKFNEDYWNGFLNGIFILLIVGFLFSLHYIETPKILSKEIPNEIDEIINFCSNKSLVKSAECVKGITKNFYEYNYSNLGKELDWETLREEGGVCEGWSNYWCKIGDKLGFNTKIIYLDTGYCSCELDGEYKNWKVSHAICFWSDETAYVNFDGLKLNKFVFDRQYCDNNNGVRMEVGVG